MVRLGDNILTRGDRRRLAACGFALVVAAAIFILVDAPDATIFWDVVFDVGHSFLFGFVMWVALLVADLIYPSTAKRWSWGAALAATLGLAVLSEGIQEFQSTRDPTVGDIVRDAAGATTVFLIYVAKIVAPISARRAALLRLSAAAIAVAVVGQLADMAQAYIERNRAFPTLATFDGSLWQRYLITTQRTALTAGNGSGFGRFPLQPGAAARLTIHETYPDWSGFQRLVLCLGSSDDVPVRLIVRINDVEFNTYNDDRFNLRVQIAGEGSQIVIPVADIQRAPKGREMDIRRIRELSLTALPVDRPTVVSVLSLRLE